MKHARIATDVCPLAESVMGMRHPNQSARTHSVAELYRLLLQTLLSVKACAMCDFQRYRAPRKALSLF